MGLYDADEQLSQKLLGNPAVRYLSYDRRYTIVVYRVYAPVPYNSYGTLAVGGRLAS